MRAACFGVLVLVCKVLVLFVDASVEEPAIKIVGQHMRLRRLDRAKIR